MESNISKIDAQLKAIGTTNDPNLFLHFMRFTNITYHADPSCTVIRITPDTDGNEKSRETFLCSCCRAQWRSTEYQKIGSRFIYANEATDTDAEQLLGTFAISIQDDFACLRDQVTGCGDAVLSRWKKKGSTREKRAALLRRLMPGIPESKHVTTRFTYEVNNWYDNPEDRSAWLLPWLSIEALLEDSTNVLHLLQNRAACPVDEWVMHDSKQLDAGWQTGALRTQHNSNCVVMYGKSYGKLTTFDPPACHQWYKIGYPRARLILEAQSLLYGFLRKFVETLLEGASETQGSDKWHEILGKVTAPGAAANTQRYTRQTWTTSPGLVLHELFETVDTRRKEAEDELWLLQTDPAYVQYLLREELSSMVVKAFSPERRWLRVVDQIFCQSINRVGNWQYLAGLSKTFAQTFEKHRVHVTPGEVLPQKLRQSLIALEHAAADFGSKNAQDLGQRMALTKTFEKYCTVEQGSDEEIEVSMKADNFGLLCTDKARVDYYKDDRLFWVLFYLRASFCLPRPLANARDGTILLEYLDDHLGHSPRSEKQRVNPHLYFLVSDLAVTDQILCAIRMHRPRFWLDHMSKVDIMACREAQPAHRTLVNKMCNSTEAMDNQLVRQVGAIHGAVWPKGVKDRKWLEQASGARTLLDSLWRSLSDVQERAMKEARAPQLEIDEAMKLCRAYESTDHQAALEVERADIERRSATPTQEPTGTELNLTFAVNALNISEKTTLNIAERKEKIKSRPQSVPQPAAFANDADEPQEEGHEPLRIAVKPNLINLFRRMYPAPNEPPAKTGTSWQQFLAAMIAAGFAVTQSSGSAVVFSRAEESIRFHRPHPDPTIDPLILQVMGKRLRKWFGWDRDVFFEREKPAV